MRFEDFQITGAYEGGATTLGVCKRLGKIVFLYCVLAVSFTFVVFLYYDIRVAVRDTPYASMWVAQLILLLGVCTLTLKKHLRRRVPLFTAYILAELCSFLLSPTHAIPYVWIASCAVLVFKYLAVGELCWLLVRTHRGVWALVWRVILGSATFILLYSILAWHGRTSIMLILDRSFSLMIATIIFSLLLFLRYFDLHVPPRLFRVAVGFLLLSCFSVLSDTILVRMPDKYFEFWGFLKALIFLASLLLWTLALKGVLPDLYGSPSPTVSGRLRKLDEKLSHFWNVEQSLRP